jgi:hypothetical protein
MRKVNFTPKNGEDIFTISVDSQDVEVVILKSFANGYVAIESLIGEPFMRGSIWGAYSSLQTVVPRTMLTYVRTQGGRDEKNVL